MMTLVNTIKTLEDSLSQAMYKDDMLNEVQQDPYHYVCGRYIMMIKYRVDIPTEIIKSLFFNK
jgi:hypothetical protein